MQQLERDPSVIVASQTFRIKETKAAGFSMFI
jgi:hypothetical protein